MENSRDLQNLNIAFKWQEYPNHLNDFRIKTFSPSGIFQYFKQLPFLWYDRVFSLTKNSFEITELMLSVHEEVYY